MTHQKSELDSAGKMLQFGVVVSFAGEKNRLVTHFILCKELMSSFEASFHPGPLLAFFIAIE